MISNIIKVGDRIELSQIGLMGRDVKFTAKVYVSQLLDIIDDANISIAVPIEAGHLVPLEIGSRYEIRILTITGMYICKGVITNRYKQNSLYFLAVNIISDLKRDQRRQYYRLERIISMMYHVITPEEDKIKMIIEKGKFNDEREKRILKDKLAELTADSPGTISNISAGGLKFGSKLKHEKNDYLQIKFTLDEMDPMAGIDEKVKVVFTDSVANKNMLYEHRVEFTDIGRETREEIIKFVFREERKQRKKESGV